MTDARRPRLVDNLPAALIAVALTAFASYSTIRSIVHPQALEGSILLLQFPGASSRSVIGINILLETIFAALIIGVALAVRSWERALVCFSSALIFLTQAMHLRPGAMATIQWIKISCATVSLVSALVLLVQFQKTRQLKRRMPEQTNS